MTMSYRKAFILLLSTQLVLWSALIGCNAAIDPFGVLGRPGGVPPDLADQRIQMLKRLAAYHREPLPQVLIGDSRIMNLGEERFEAFTGAPVANLGIGGLAGSDLGPMFWFAARQERLQQVTIGVSFSQLRGPRERSSATQAIRWIESPLHYLLSTSIARYSLLAAVRPWYSVADVNTVPTMGPEAFWEHQLGLTTSTMLSGFTYDEALIAEFRRIKEYCDARRIQLTFLIPPTHVDLHQSEARLGLVPYRERLRVDLASISRTIDFDYPNGWTTDRKAFNDPYHATDAVNAQLIEEVWGGRLKVGRELRPGDRSASVL